MSPQNYHKIIRISGLKITKRLVERYRFNEIKKFLTGICIFYISNALQKADSLRNVGTMLKLGLYFFVNDVASDSTNDE